MEEIAASERAEDGVEDVVVLNHRLGHRGVERDLFGHGIDEAFAKGRDLGSCAFVAGVRELAARQGACWVDFDRRYAMHPAGLPGEGNGKTARVTQAADEAKRSVGRARDSVCADIERTLAQRLGDDVVGRPTEQPVGVPPELLPSRMISQGLRQGQGPAERGIDCDERRRAHPLPHLFVDQRPALADRDLFDPRTAAREGAEREPHIARLRGAVDANDPDIGRALELEHARNLSRCT